MQRLLFAVSVCFFVFESLVPRGLAAPLSDLPRHGYPPSSFYVAALGDAGTSLYVAPVYLYGEFEFAFNQLTGAVEPWDPRSEGGILQILSHSNLVYLAGTFTGFRQGPENALISRTFLASVDANNGKLTEWNPTIEGFWIEGFRPAVLAIAAQSDVIFIGGEFNKVSGSNRTNLAAVDRKTGLATSWAANIQSYYGGGIFTVRTMVLHANDLIVGGSFYNVAGEIRTNLVMIDATTGSVKPFNLAPMKATNPPSDNIGSVRKVAIHDNILYIAGTFTTVGDTPRAGVAAVDLQTQTVTDWNPQANGEVRDFAFDLDGIYLGGQFTSVGSSNRANLAMVDYATGKPLSWNPSPNGPVSALLFENGRLFAGGKFTQVGTNAVSYLAVFAEEGSFWFDGGDVVGSEFQGKLFGEEGKNYIIEGSTDLGAWQKIARGQPVNGSISFSDPIGTSGKFYRSRLIE